MIHSDFLGRYNLEKMNSNLDNFFNDIVSDSNQEFEDQDMFSSASEFTPFRKFDANYHSETQQSISYDLPNFEEEFSCKSGYLSDDKVEVLEVAPKTVLPVAPMAVVREKIFKCTQEKRRSPATPKI